MSPETKQEIQWLTRVEDLFMRCGVKSVTMDDVAAELGVSKKTIYQWVESKDDMVLRVLSHHISREKDQCITLAARASNAIDEIFILLDSNSQDLSQMKSNIVHDLQKYHHKAWEMMRKFQYDFMYKVIRNNLQRGRTEGLYREDFDEDIIARLHLAAAFSLFDPQLFPDHAYSRITLIREYILHYLHGIVSPKGLTYLKQKLY